ncbi:hypothetical protein KAU11_11155 [Candidatus Babeliales bacterium]|nr:hypothetical protein [Candidatus Babeliales bacterium]
MDATRVTAPVISAQHQLRSAASTAERCVPKILVMQQYVIPVKVVLTICVMVVCFTGNMTDKCQTSTETNESCSYCGRTCEKTPDLSAVCDPCKTLEHVWDEEHKPTVKPVFNPESLKDSISSTLPPCVNCESSNVIAVRRTDIIYAVTKCIECLHLRQLTVEEYLAEWPQLSNDEQKPTPEDTLG